MSHHRPIALGLPLSLSLLMLAGCASPPLQVGEPASAPASQPSAQDETLDTLALKPLPAGGTDVLGADTFNAFKGGASDTVRLEVIPISGRSFTRAWRFTGNGPSESPTSSQLTAFNRTRVQKGDTLVVQFRARSVGGPAQTELVFESDGDYVQSALIPLNLLPVWKLYSVPFTARRDMDIGQAAARFRPGYDKQSFELGGVVLKNYGPGVPLSALPFGGFSYVGREQNAAWRTAAAARIEALRKGDLTVRVQDAGGKPLAGAAVKLEMQRHAFGFGSAVNADLIVDASPEAQTYRQKVQELFSRVVFENDLKWPSWEDPGSRAQTLKALDYFRAQGLPVRGHNLLWGCAEDDCFPRDVPPLFANPAGLRARIEQHFADVLGATRGKIAEWDVINEPSGGTRFSDALGEDEMAAQLRQAKVLDPAACLVINENGTLGEGNNTATFTRILKRVQALGAPLEGIGLQGHFNFKLTPPEDLNARLNTYGQLKVPISITEFDISLPDEQLQADFLRDVLTVAFANENVSSFMLWGFWAGRINEPNAALLRSDWSLKPNGQVFRNLVLGQWWTRVAGVSGSDGRYRTRGFYGDYKLSVTVNGRTSTRTIKLQKGMGEVVIKLP
jgi:endo-1,4-beta-xylanase